MGPDRIKMMSPTKERRFLSTQALINCGMGSCAEGGDANDVYNFAHKSSIPGFGKGPCHETRKYTAYKAEEFGRVKGAMNMKKETLARGPIACTMMSTNKFYYGYKGGIYSEIVDMEKEPNHVINVTGWGKTKEGQEFWIVRNSWGTYWGENGYYRVVMGEGSMRIEEDCDWVVPEMIVVDLDAKQEKLQAVDN